MVFTVACPECNSEFPVDSAKVPEEGVYAQCSMCPGTFLVERPAEEPAASGEVAMSTAGAQFDSGPVGGMAHEAPESPAEEPVAAPAAVADKPAFGQNDPDARAARLARVLVSDMMTYNPAMYEKAMEAGTLAEDFEEEVKRSWSEYVEQVGEELARSTPHFTRALNDILAKGEEVFEESMYE